MGATPGASARMVAGKAAETRHDKTARRGRMRMDRLRGPVGAGGVEVVRRACRLGIGKAMIPATGSNAVVGPCVWVPQSIVI